MPMPAQVCLSRHACYMHIPYNATACIVCAHLGGSAGMPDRPTYLIQGVHAAAWCSALPALQMSLTHLSVCTCSSRCSCRWASCGRTTRRVWQSSCGVMCSLRRPSRTDAELPVHIAGWARPSGEWHSGCVRVLANLCASGVPLRVVEGRGDGQHHRDHHCEAQAGDWPVSQGRYPRAQCAMPFVSTHAALCQPCLVRCEVRA
jgi:hypothetical protein